MEKDEPLFPGVHGYDDTVIPQITNAVLSRHHFILLGLRGQAKSRILRGLAGFLTCNTCDSRVRDQRQSVPTVVPRCREELPRRATHAISWLSRNCATWRSWPRQT